MDTKLTTVEDAYKQLVEMEAKFRAFIIESKSRECQFLADIRKQTELLHEISQRSNV